MILAGDELSHTQGGNNNAYCQDNEISWLDWELDDRQREFVEFVQRMIRLRREHPVLRRRKFFQGRAIRGTTVKDLSWFEPSGQEMADEAWNAGFVRCIGVCLAGREIHEVDERGQPIVGNTLLLLLNASENSIPFSLPRHQSTDCWQRLLDTADAQAARTCLPAETAYNLRERSMAVFLSRPTDAAEGDSGGSDR